MEVILKDRKEKDVWRELNKNAPGHYERIETKTPGISDVIYTFRDRTTGFIELKNMEEWPKAAPTNFGLRSEQALFLERWTRHGGLGFVFARIGDDYILIHGKDALELYRKVSRDRAIEMAAGFWSGSMDWRAFSQHLRNIYKQ